MPDVQEVFRMATQKVRPDPGALEQQFREQRRRTVRRKVGAYAAVAAVSVVAALIGVRQLGGPDPRETDPVQRPEPTVEGRAPTPQDLAGMWLMESGPVDGPLIAQFRADNLSFSFDTFEAADQDLFDAAALGSYRLDGRTMTFFNGNFTACPAGDRWAWQVGVPEDGRLHIVELDPTQVPDDVQGDCDRPGEYRWIRVSPASRAGASITAEAPPGAGDPPSTPSDLRGLWLREGTGQVVRFGARGHYYLDDGGLVGDSDDTGDFQVDPNGTITFTTRKLPAPGPGECAVGDRMVWEEAELGAGTLRVTVSEDTCSNNAGAEWTWIRLVP